MSEQNLDARRRLRQQIVDAKAVVAQRRLAGQHLPSYVTLSIEQAESLERTLERAERVEKVALAAAIAVQDPDGFIAGDPWEGWIDAMEALRAAVAAAPGGESVS